MSDTVGCLRLTIPSVRSLRRYMCASCSNNHTTTTNTANTLNRRIIVVPPNRFGSIERQPTILILYQINQKRT